MDPSMCRPVVCASLVVAGILAGLLAACGGDGRNGEGNGSGGGSADASGEGGIRVTITVARCPKVSSIGIAPSETAVGSTVDVMAWATVQGDASPTFAWTAPTGIFADSGGAPGTTYECTAPGPVTLTVTAMNDGCNDKATAQVSCHAVDGGSD
jgi:hypothetical protein